MFCIYHFFFVILPAKLVNAIHEVERNHIILCY